MYSNVVAAGYIYKCMSMCVLCYIRINLRVVLIRNLKINFVFRQISLSVLKNHLRKRSRGNIPCVLDT